MKDGLNQTEFPLLNYKNYLHYSYFIKWTFWSCSHNSVKGVRIWCMTHALLQHRQPATIFLFHRNFFQDTEVLASPLPLSLRGQMKPSLFALFGQTEGLQSNTISSKVLQRNSFIREIVASKSFIRDWKVSMKLPRNPCHFQEKTVLLEYFKPLLQYHAIHSVCVGFITTGIKMAA